MTLATVKLMFVVNNARKFAAIPGFFEALITILALSRIMQDASDMAAYVMRRSSIIGKLKRMMGDECMMTNASSIPGLYLDGQECSKRCSFF